MSSLSRWKMTAPALRAGLLVLAVGFATAPVGAQEANAAAAETTPAAPPARATGDAWLDEWLADIDRYAARYPDAFADELERYAGVPRAYVAGLLAQPRWSGGDAWFACFLARAVQATCRSVVRTRTRLGPEADWEAVAAEFDAAPGSDAYARVRLALADSYRRWDRPLQPDAALRRALREREAEATAASKAAAASKGSASARAR
ncbi:hypothetical protein [Pseudoxanthomonas suwonensis]|uniref:hypothetical protein n=1 Tax=Pseudoxanthomonas suwonensis TaxID=314722 RepID=UPI0004B635DF|nr:hypothetical protein [Pseudoxanthomonas suwonensis]